MPRLRTYTETLEFRRYESGHRVILPSPLDLAIKRMTLAEQDAELDMLERQGEPGEIAKARLLLPKLKGPELDMAVKKISAYELRVSAQQEGWLTAMFRTQRALEKAEGQLDHPGELGGEPETQRFEMREFSQRERLAADEDHAELQEREDGQTFKTVAVDPRNLQLLDLAIVGEWVTATAFEAALAAGEPYELAGEKRAEREIDGEPCVLVVADAAADLQQMIAQTLIGRMWAKNTMSPELAGFFGKQPPPSRLTSPSLTS